MVSNDIGVIEKNEYQKILTEYTEELRKRALPNKLVEFAEMRNFPIETVKDCGIFFIGEMAEMLLPNYMDKVEQLGVISPTNNKPIFRERWVIPIKTEKGLVQNLVGYKRDADERYIYGKAKYYRRTDTLWGLENLWVAYDMGYAFLTEGITDAIRLRSLGYLNSFATCGTQQSDFILKQLNRCRYGVIEIPDRDIAGIRAAKGWKLNRTLTLKVALKYKDFDEMCSDSEENIEWAQQYLEDCVAWIKQTEHRGQICASEEVTMI